MSELYKKYRPKTLKGIVGQDAAVSTLKQQIDQNTIPHAVLFSGPSGSGKTTIARILQDHLECGDQDYQELNCADFRGIEMVRDVRKHAILAPLEGNCRIWLIDECHKLSNDAQNAFLKLLEDTPPHVYFFLATTEPQKLLPTIRTRCTEIKLGELNEKQLTKLVRRVAGREKLELSDTVKQEIVEAAEGSARKALVILGQAGYLENEEDQIAAIQASSGAKDEAIKLARELINPKADWKKIAPILKDLKDDPEGIRHLVLSYCRSVLLGGGHLAPRAYKVIDIFADNFYDSKQAGLAAACWEVVNS